MGTENNKNIGFYGGPSGWGFTYDAINSRVGIGNTTPVNRLDVAGLNNWDLTNTEGDMRIGSNSYRIKFGVALGGAGAGSSTIMQYGQPGGVNNLALGSQGKNYININGSGDFIDLTNISGGIRINGNAGTAGQVIQSNGSGAAPTWSTSSKPYVLSFNQTDYADLNAEGVFSVHIPGLSNQLIPLQQASSIIFNASFDIARNNISSSQFYMRISIINNASNQEAGRAFTYGLFESDGLKTVHGIFSANLPAGIYRTEVLLVKVNSGNSFYTYTLDGRVILQVLPN